MRNLNRNLELIDKSIRNIRHLSLGSPTTTTTTTSSSSCSLGGISSNHSLPPIRYKIFPRPIPYLVGLRLQDGIIERRLRDKRDGKGGKSDVLLLLEHTPTYTTGRRDSSPNPTTLHPEEKKGGQVTYHGPGQLVGYPILDLNVMETPTRCYVEYLQALLADYVRDQGVKEVLAPHPEGHVGVFTSPTEKIASIGIHLRHRITSHGFAMNITPEPIKWFDLVTACGLTDVHAVCLQDLLPQSGNTLNVKNVARDMVPRFQDVFGREFVELSEEEIHTKEGEVEEDVRAIRELCAEAEKESEGTTHWPSEPDLTKRIS
ncbi:hypothetical protein BCR39DRAFT_574722 [Naematelia encephala]|uniref:lipoyl(octanoyl) transferase n=1 Tax=Naematelia encephala TaxID=71784 RepID=A0A1Y2B4L1_9TREE|nr:hypothetical protein BCR39DRAFT_574722 [Naematelia encephala]